MNRSDMCIKFSLKQFENESSFVCNRRLLTVIYIIILPMAIDHDK